MFKNATIFKFSGVALCGSSLERQLLAHEFQPCAPTQHKSTGFFSPRHEHGALVESVDGNLIIQITSEVRRVPPQALAKRIKEISDKVFDETGRKPGKGQRKEIRERATLELLPSAFPARSCVRIWLSIALGLVVMDTSSMLRSDEVAMLLVSCIPGLQLTLVQTEMTPAGAMTAWLASGESPYQFTFGRECELRSTDEQRSFVRYGRHSLDMEQVKEHVTQGKVATKLALTWRDRVSFVLDDCMRIKKLTFLDVVFESSVKGNKLDQAEAFDADVAIMAGELQQMLPDLFEALGGLQTIGLGEAQ